MHVHAAQFGAPVQGGVDLAGVQQMAGVEGALDPLLLLQVVLGEHGVHQVALLDADAVLAGEHPADLDAHAQDIGAHLFHLLQFPRLVGVVQDQRVQVAVPGVEYVGDAEAVLLGQGADALEHMGQLVARDGAVHAVIVRRDAPHRREGRLAAGPEFQAFLFVAADADVDGAAFPGDGLDPRDQVLHFGLGPVQLHDQQRLHVPGVAGVDEVLGGVDGGSVHHLHAAGNDAGADDGGDAIARRLVGGEPDEEGARAFGLLQDAHGDLGDDAQKPFRAGHQPEKVVGLAVQVLAAEADDLAADEDHLQTQEVVRRQAVFQAVHAARIGAHVAADGTGDLARRIGRVVEAPVLDGVGNAQVGDARLGDDDAVLVIDVEDPVELAEPHGDAVGERQGAPGEGRAGAAGNDLDAFGKAE